MKKILSVFLLSAVASAGIPVPAAQAAAVPVVTARSAVLVSSSGKQFIYSKNSSIKLAPASTTKLLTALLAVEHLSLDQVVTIPAFAESIEPSKMYAKAGEKYYVRDLVRATLISSSNDVAEVLAHTVSGSREKFAVLMNKKARSIGANHSNFVRASGLPAKNQYSTARDLAKIMSHAQRYPFIVKTLKTKGMTIRSLGGRKIYLRNHNKMLWKDSRDVVGKTGWTRKARHCFVGLIEAHGKKVYIAMMGSHSLWRDLRKLIDYQFGSSLSSIQKNRKIWSVAETKKIQTALKRAGYSPGSVDGKFGPRTIRAIEGFQKAKGLGQDGVVGPVTWKQLRRYLA